MTAIAENPLITALRDQRDAAQDEIDRLLEAPKAERRNLNEAESAKFDEHNENIETLDKRIADLVDLDKRKNEAAEARKAIGVQVVNEPNPVYRGDAHGPSFFRDIASMHLRLPNETEARSRLADAQLRTGDLSTTAGVGGEFAPPRWLVDQYVKLARAGRVAADRLQHEVLPGGISSINLPAVNTGTSVAVQQTQNTSVSDTAMSTTSISSGIVTLAGKQTVSRQIIDQSGTPFDRVVLGDLAADYAKQLDIQVLAGTTANGQLNGLVTVAGNAISWTATQPVQVSATTANSFYYQVISAINKVQTNRFDSPTAILMHPRRWNWMLAALDGNTRPLVTPTGPEFNAVATADGGAPAQGMAGNMLGIPVFIDANATTGTNQDIVFVLKADDSWLYESQLEAASFDATYADQATILFRVLGYAALIHRYAKSISKISGVGLVDPGL